MVNAGIRLCFFIFCVIMACCLSPLAAWSRTDEPASMGDAHISERLR